MLRALALAKIRYAPSFSLSSVAATDEEGKIAPLPKTKDTAIRYAPTYTTGLAANPVKDSAYTTETLVTFLGFVQPDGQATTAFLAAFGALELIKEGYLTEARIKGQSDMNS